MGAVHDWKLDGSVFFHDCKFANVESSDTKKNNEFDCRCSIKVKMILQHLAAVKDISLTNAPSACSRIV